MAGTGGSEGNGGSEKGAGGGGGDCFCSFEWDDDSQLYFHASSGFYHDPNAGWYFSSRDGLYYRFENGSYVPWESNKNEESEAHQCASSVSSAPSRDNACSTQYVINDGIEMPPPPSEWLEETLIDLYLAGYSHEETNAGSSTKTLGTNGEKSNHANELLADKLSSEKLFGCHHSFTLDEVKSENTPEDVGEAPESSDKLVDEDVLWDEEKWQTQYGQVIQSENEDLLAFPVVNLWDWAMVKEIGKKKCQVSRLVGRLVRRSTKLHPSVPTGGGLLKTAAIREVHLDLVRVASGKVYRLRSPSAGYLSSLSTYDSSNPTKDWAFPELIILKSSVPSFSFSESDITETSDLVVKCEGSSASHHQLASEFNKSNYRGYRDRAAERRTLYGGFGIGPGQKKSVNDNIGEEDIFSESIHTEEATNEAINMSFGAGSYARRILEGMGWKEGEALGQSTKGLLEPLQAVGNKGNAGLGWNTER